MRELSAAQKEAIKKRIRRACCDMARKMGMSASFTSTGIRIAQGSSAHVFDFRWNPLSNMWDLYHGETWLAGRSQFYPNVVAYVMNHGVPNGPRDIRAINKQKGIWITEETVTLKKLPA